jgi:hypothetical protein
VKIKSIIFLLIFSTGCFSQQVKPLRIVAEMYDSIKTIKTVRFKVKALERINGVYVSTMSENKIQSEPKKIYFHNKEKKLEILYVAGTNNNKAYVKPHTFPFITVSLDPSGSLMRKNVHYTIFELGFEYAGKAIALALNKEKDVSKNLVCRGKQVLNGYNCYVMVYENKSFSYYEYTVLQKETVTSIAAKLNVNDYMLRSKNNLYNDFGYIKSGTKLSIPTLYAKKVVFYIDEKTMLPVNISVFDDIGLFESYDYSDIVLNKPFDPLEFTKGYKDYDF